MTADTPPADEPKPDRIVVPKGPTAFRLTTRLVAVAREWDGSWRRPSDDGDAGVPHIVAAPDPEPT